MKHDVASLNAAIRRQEADRRAAAKGFAKAMMTGTPEDVDRAVLIVDHAFVWPMAMRAIARTLGAPLANREMMLAHWLSHGDHIRCETGDDLVLASALRNALPSYQGPSLTLYRGEGWANRCRRTYGLSWSTRREVAEAFANDRRKDYQDGSCLLSVVAPPEAIICIPLHHVQDRYDEAEVLLDRRFLVSVRALERLRPIAEHTM